MKPLICLFLMILAGLPGMAAEAPPELAANRQNFAQSVQRVTAPLLQEYVLSLEALKKQYTQENKLPQAITVVAEINRVKAQLEVIEQQIVIISATYGTHSDKRVVDVTPQVKAAVARLDPMIVLGIYGASEGVDPAQGVNKKTVIIYTVNGQRREKTFDEGHPLILAKDLK